MQHIEVAVVPHFDRWIAAIRQLEGIAPEKKCTVDYKDDDSTFIPHSFQEKYDSLAATVYRNRESTVCTLRVEILSKSLQTIHTIGHRLILWLKNRLLLQLPGFSDARPRRTGETWNIWAQSQKGSSIISSMQTHFLDRQELYQGTLKLEFKVHPAHVTFTHSSKETDKIHPARSSGVVCARCRLPA